MLIVDTFSVRSILLSLSLITIAINSFSTSYNTMSAVESKIRQRTETAQSGIPYKISDAYKYLMKQNLMSIVKRNRLYCILICICFFLSFLSIFVKPVGAENYTMIIGSTQPYVTIVNVSNEDESHSNSKQIDDDQGETQITVNQSEFSTYIDIYIWCTTILSLTSLILLAILIINMFKIQRIQIILLKLDKDFSFR